MKRIRKYIRLSFFFIVFTVLLSACKQDEPVDSPYVDERKAQSTILIYAVATNSLAGNLISDKQEMLEAHIDTDKNNVLIFQTVYEYDEETYQNTGRGDVSLIKMVKTDTGYGWQTVKEYDNETASLNPQRVEEIIDYVLTDYPAQKYGLIFWSHSTGAQPYTPATRGVENLPMEYSFGQDKTTPDTAFEQINVEDLASAIPNGVFDFIWFDSCYMSNIESIYEFRGKCLKYIGYPTEVLEYGLPYDIVLPYLVGKNPQIELAADTFFRYYAENPYSYLQIATIAVIDMNRIQILTDFCKKIYNLGTDINSLSSLHKYTRYSTGPFYDLGDYTKAMAVAKGTEFNEEEWQEVLNECVSYRNSTPTDFVGIVDPERYTGISTHVYNFTESTKTEQYYQGLGWFKNVFYE